MEKMNEDDLINWMKLTQVPNLGPKRIKDLFEIFGNINSITNASAEELLRTRAFREDMLKEWEKLKNSSNTNFIRAIRECEESNIKIINLFDKEYPYKLRRIPYPPLTLFLKGDISLLGTRKIAIVGTREAGEEAKEWAFKNAMELAKEGITIVSGGARGIDSLAHKGALNVINGRTICVLGTGFFKMFPEENMTLFEEIIKKGLLISEHLPNFPGSRFSLIQRNRITSGISDALINVASGLVGGAMVQTKIAYQQKIPIFCPSSSLNLTPNEGIKKAINEYGAKEIFSLNDILDIYSKKHNIPL
jgi:DNA processing protein